MGLASVLPSQPSKAALVLLPDVPLYYSDRGCAPIAGSMLVGYYDGRPGYQNLVADGVTPQQLAATPSDGKKNSLADFMDTKYPWGYTYDSMIAKGMEAYLKWDDPDTGINESYQATAWNEYSNDPEWIENGYVTGELTWSDYVSEIDTGRPVLLSWGTANSGHTTIGIGYDDFNSTNPQDWRVALYTTWEDSAAPEWWYFDPAVSALNPDGWNLDLATFVHITPQPVPLPSSLLLFGTLLPFFLLKRRRALRTTGPV